jgi:ribosomal protein S14
MVHDEPLPNRTCNGCNTEFYDPKSRRGYCDSCNPNAGQHNGNWTDATETGVCQSCEDEFEYYPSDKDGTYCPECVRDADGLLPDNPSEPTRLTTECANCGTGMMVVPSRIQNRTHGVFCSRECHSNWLSQHIVGANHHQWEGGPLQYGGSWWRVRRDALERDDYRCQSCGKSRDDLDRNPDVHHRNRVRDFDDPDDAHRLDNVITLCRSCHQRVENGSLNLD